MAARSTGDGKKILLLILFVILLLGASMLIIDFVGTIFGVHFPVPGLKYLKIMSLSKKVKQAEDPYLLEKEEILKNKERLNLFEEQLATREKELRSFESENTKKLNALKEKEEELNKKVKLLDDRENQFADKKKNVREQAVKLYNMPPKDSVALLEKQSESDIVDILREIDTYSVEIGRQSISPYLLKLMGDINNQKAANVVRKLKYSAGTNDSAVETLDESKVNIEEPPQP
jgi:flagellar motility protein MotE (MotC chaperone)